MIQLEFWSPAGNLTLEPNAELAVKSQAESLAVIAGPGAGKTELLAQRADFLLKTNTCRYPKRILAISFKTDASKTLKNRVEKRCGNQLSQRFDSYTFHAFSKRIIDIFRVHLTGDDRLVANYSIGPKKVPHTQIRFQDLTPLALSIITNLPIAKRTIVDTYTDVFLDEFQDCTDLQYQLFNLLFVGTDTRLVAVGDNKQRIMKWANAMDGVFASFTKDFNAKPIQLLYNYRGCPIYR